MTKRREGQSETERGNIINEINELKSALKSATPSNFSTLRALVDKLLSENLPPAVKKIVDNLSKAVFEKELQIQAAHGVRERAAEEEVRAAEAIKIDVDKKILEETIEANQKNHELEILHHEKEARFLKDEVIDFSIKLSNKLDERNKLHKRLISNNPPLNAHEKALLTNDRNSPHVSKEQWEAHDENEAFIQNQIDKTYKLRDHSLKSIKLHKSKIKLNQDLIEHPKTTSEHKAKLHEENKKSAEKIIEHENNVKATNFVEESRKKELAEMLEMSKNGNHDVIKILADKHYKKYKSFYEKNLDNADDKMVLSFHELIVKNNLADVLKIKNVAEKALNKTLKSDEANIKINDIDLFARNKSVTEQKNSNLNESETISHKSLNSILPESKDSINYANNIKKHLNDSVIDQNNLKPSSEKVSPDMRKRSQSINI